MSDARSEARETAPAGLEALIYAALDVLRERGPRALEEFLREHPSEAGVVRDQLEHLVRLGLAPGTVPASEVPDRLGDFRLLELLGEGGMGVVYAARQESLGRSVAIKLLRPDALHLPGARERFRREVEALARLQHPGIVPVLGAGEEAGVSYVAMERLNGCTLAQALEQLAELDPSNLQGADLARVVAARAAPGADDARPSGTLFEGSWRDACLRIARDIAEALEHAHARGIVHRDVKPANIAVTLSGRALLFDFGLALTEGSQRLTHTGGQAGSLPYMSPEQVDGRRDLDGRTDIWSLGATLYELLTLRTPFASASSELTRRRILAADAERPRRYHRGLDPDVECVVLCALEREPARRYAGGAELARDLANALEGRPVEADRGGPWRHLGRWRRRHPRVSAALLAAAGVAFVALGVIAWRESSRRRVESDLRGAAEESAALAVERAAHAARSAEEAQLRSREAVAAAELAESRRLEAEAERRKVLRLSDARRLALLESEVVQLFPAGPDRVEAADAWLLRADQLRGRLREHRRALSELGALSSAPDLETQWQIDALDELVRALEVFIDPDTGRMAQVEQLLEQSLSIEEQSIGGAPALAAWEAAARSIRDECPAYGGLELEPQLGLFPLGRDPDSGLWEFAELRSGALPRRGPDGRLAPQAEDAVVLVLLPGGRFPMGSQSVDPNAPCFSAISPPEEGPVHELVLSPFFMGKFELTQGQWQRMTGSNPSQFRAGTTAQGTRFNGAHPVEMIDWFEAGDGLRRVGLALPTEAQWEYAARAGTDTPWYTGDGPRSLASYVNLAGAEFNLDSLAIGWQREEWLDDGYPIHAPVGSFGANAFGLHDVLGNVSEWCLDRFSAYGDPARPGDGLRAGAPPWNVNRGGSFNENAGLQRVAVRFQATPDYRNGNLGVRAARGLTP